MVETNDSRFILTDTTLDMGEGPSETVTLSFDLGVSGGTFSLVFDGEETRPISADATNGEIKASLVELAGIGDDEVRVDLITSDLWRITFRGDKAGIEVPDMALGTVALVGGGGKT